ncbi:hypothetical protein EYF80_063954 [Liparis tanakae]|uniref:Uncharacterized protein n=1 Tax=Liparis tanakae TaxID=230148 RepID=A0A4Z2EBH1_9TELE|nr:hypothetical protein EYF80_063954 [Liparis tanakae]
MSALAVTLQTASLCKKDLELDLEELEEAATMVAGEEEEEEEEEEEGGAAPTSHSEDSDDSSGGGDSSGESEESEAEGQSCGGGGEGPSEDNAPPSRLLIQELGERVAEALTISQDAKAADATSGGSGRGGGTLLEPSPRRNPLLIVPDAGASP